LAAAAAVFTANRVKAAPVLWTQQVLRGGRVRAVLLNSGGANACTGPQGFTESDSDALRGEVAGPWNERSTLAVGLTPHQRRIDFAVQNHLELIFNQAAFLFHNNYGVQPLSKTQYRLWFDRPYQGRLEQRYRMLFQPPLIKC